MWRLVAKSVVDDPVLRDCDKKRTLVDSLLGEALHLSSTLAPTATAEDFIGILDKHFGDVSDGFELYSQFRSAIQESQETATEFLRRLQTLAIRVVETGGMKATDLNGQVLRQFESSCGDEDLLLRLGLRDKFDKPDDVNDLIHKVRHEEDRRKVKKLKLKAKTAKANAVSAAESDVEVLRKKVESLQQQVEASKKNLSSCPPAASGGASQVQVR